MSKFERSVRRLREREEEIVATVENLLFVEECGLDPVVDKLGRFVATPHEVGTLFDGKRRADSVLRDLHDMSKFDYERGVLIEAYRRYKEEV
jgi:hypothetical protein